MRLELRQSLILAGALLLGLAVVFAVTQTLLSRESRSQQEARLEFQLDNLRADIEANLQLGFPIDEITPAQDLIEEARRNDSTLLALDIFTPEGISLYSTDRGVIGEPVPPSWLAAAEGAGPEGRWTYSSRGETLLGLPIRNDLGETVAQIVSVTSSQDLEARESGLMQALLLHGLWIVPLALLLAVAFAVVLARREAGRFHRAAACLRGENDGGGEATHLEAAAVSARQHGTRVVERLDNAGRRLEEVENGL